MNIVGSSYFESCTSPSSEEIYGSGGRAAASLAPFDHAIVLDTFIGESERPHLQVLADHFRFSVREHHIDTSLQFVYDHPLSEPRIYPKSWGSTSPIQIEEEKILSFGFLEGYSVIKGDIVVYDPQNTNKPESFGLRGSTAGRLALVCNAGQCRSLAGEEDLVVAGRKLLNDEGAEAVVIKQGSLGATVVTQSGETIVPAFRTTRVWKIGSGDVFAAIFSHYWMNEGASPVDSAYAASLATANYCQTRTLPIPLDFLTKSDFQPIENESGFPGISKSIYLAGPFFTLASLWLIAESRAQLRKQGFRVFSPYHDVGTGSATEVVPADIKGIEDCDLMFAIVDGLDSGTIFEIGYARALNKPVIAFVQNESNEDLKMLEGTGCEVVRDFTTAVYMANWKAMSLRT